MIHRHIWEIIGVKHMTFLPTAWSRLPEHAINPTTLVLSKCKRCPKIKTHRIDGHWTLEQMKGVKEET